MRKDKKGRWKVEFQQGGRRVHKVLPEGATRQDAQRLESRLRQETFRVGELGDAPAYTIGEAVMRYLKEFTGKSRKQTESHAAALEPFIVGRLLSDVVPVANLLREKGGGSHSTRNRRLAILRRVANLAYRRWGWLKEPLGEKIELLPENKAREVYLNRSELAALLWKIKHRESRRACLVAAFTGLRKGELLGLEPDNPGLICLKDSKTGHARNVPVIRSIRFALKRPFQVSPTYLSKAVQKASGGKVRFHDLRHTTASLLLNAGVDLYVVGMILGHKSLQTTKRYSHLSTKAAEAAMNRLETSPRSHTKKTNIG
jgi:integrase